MQLQVLMMLFPFYLLHLTQIRLSGNNSFWALLLISILGQFVVPTDKRNLAKFELHTIYSFYIITKTILSHFGHVGMINYAHNWFFQILGMWNSSNYFHFVQNGVKHGKKIKSGKIYWLCRTILRGETLLKTYRIKYQLISYWLISKTWLFQLAV